MQRSDDIYNEDQPPAFARRVTQRSNRSRNKRLSRNKLVASQTSHRKRMVAPDASSPSFKPRRTRSAVNNHVPQKIMLMGLLVVLIGYLGFLFISFLAKSSSAKSVGVAKKESISKVRVRPEHLKGDDVEKQVVALIKNSFIADQQLAQAYDLIADEKYEQAQQRISQALEHMPYDQTAQKALSEVLMGQKKYEEAQESLLASLNRTPSDLDLRLALAGVLSVQGEDKSVLQLTRWILADHPYSIRAHHLAAVSLVHMGENKEAIIHLRKILNLNNQHKSAQSLLGMIYRKEGAYDKAVNLLKEQLITDNHDSVTYYNLALCYAGQNKVQNAVDWLSQAVDLFGSSFVEVWLQCADFDTIRADPAFVAFMKQLKGLKEK